MYFSQDTLGCVVSNTHPVVERSHEVKSSLCGGKAVDISLVKSIVGERSMNNSSTQCTSLPLDIPASTDAHQAKQVFDLLPLEAKIQYLTQSQYSPQSGLTFSSLFNLKDHLRTQLTETAISKIEGICALYGALCSVNDAAGFLAVLTLYAKTHSQTAIITQLASVVDKLFAGYSPQSTGTRPA